MKRKLSLLLAMILAMTMVMGIGVTAFADGSNQFEGTTWVLYRFVVAANPGDPNGHDYSIGDTVQTDNPFILAEDTLLVKFMENGVCEVNMMGTTAPSTYDPTTGTITDFNYPPSVTSGLEGNSYIVVVDYCTYYLRKLGGGVANPESHSSPAHVHNFQWQTITEPTKDADGLEGEVCSCGAVRNTQPLSAYGYALNEYATPMINAAKAGQTITFEFGEWNSFPKSFMAKLVDKSAQNVTFVFKYKWNHKLQTITIPAGTPIDLNFDWYGPAKMAELYGAN